MVLPVWNAAEAAETDESFSILLDDTTVLNYFPATGTSTNNHYTVKGVYITTTGDIHLILDNDKNTANQTRFYNPKLNGMEAAGYGLSHEDYQPYWEEVGGNYTLNFSDGSTSTITGVRMFVFNLGPMMYYLQASNTLQILNQAGGFSIEGMTFTLNLGHEISKKVNSEESVTALIGEELIYTVTVINTGQLPLGGINVYDDEPDGITIIGISENNTDWNNNPQKEVTEDENGNEITVVTLASGLSLDPGKSKTYYVKAVVNEDANHDDVIVNTAYTGGNVPRQEDTAEATVQVKVRVIIKKIITGNFGDMSREFQFAVRINGNEQPSFSLGHGGTKVYENLDPGDVITLLENSQGYDVTVKTGENVIQPDSEGRYIITLPGIKEITITVSNHKEVNISTGVSLDSLPYVIILALVIAGISIHTGTQASNRQR